MEAKFIALEKVGVESEWLRSLLEDIPLWIRPVQSVLLHCDNQVAIARAKNNVYNGKIDIYV